MCWWVSPAISNFIRKALMSSGDTPNKQTKRESQQELQVFLSCYCSFVCSVKHLSFTVHSIICLCTKELTMLNIVTVDVFSRLFAFVGFFLLMDSNLTAILPLKAVVCCKSYNKKIVNQEQGLLSRLIFQQ